MRLSSSLVALSCLAPTLLLSACGTSVPLDNTAPPPTMESPDMAPSAAQDGAVSAPADFGDNGAPSNMYPAPFPDPPQVISLRGAVLTAPRIIPIFFAGDDANLAAKIADFSAKIGTSEFWKQTTSEYRVGPATSTPLVTIAETLANTVDDSAIQAWLAGKLNNNDPALPALGPQDIFLIHYPANVTITFKYGGGVQKSCSSFGGYHSNIELDAKHRHQTVAYAVIPRCKVNGSQLDALTVVDSHELTEAATDPYPQTGPAYAQVDEDHFLWALLIGGGEVSDMCEALRDANVKPQDLGYVVQRGWSNAAAKGGHNPCVPAPAGPYYNAVPEFNEYVDYYTGGVTYSLPGINIPVGQSRTITLDLFSDGPTAPFTVNARNSRFSGTYLSFALDRTTGVNGEKLHLTITSNSQSPRAGIPFVIESSLNGATYTWYGLVGQAQ